MPDATLADPHHDAHDGATAPGLGLAGRLGWTLLPAALLAAVLSLILNGPMPYERTLSWVPALGIEAAFRIDGLSLMMLLLISGIGVAVFTYAGAYMDGDPKQVRLYGLLTAFMVAMAGAVTADDVILLFVFWEATSILSFLLVGLKHEKSDARKSAQQALLVTGTGGLMLLAGLLILAHHFGTTQLSAIVTGLAAADPSSPVLTAGIVLVVAGCFTKSAQFPFHFWLPGAMAAPTPVSAYLHSATMVKLGVFLLARFDAGVGEWPVWTMLLQALGSVTAAWGMVLALSERDLKRILAWSTVATLGTLVVLVGLPGPDASVAVGSLLLAHALYKAPLFFVAGNVDHGAGTRIIDNLGNLRRTMPLSAAAAALAGLSMAGVPLSFGYVVKVTIYEAKGVEGVLAWVPLANQVFAALAVAVAGMAAVRLFWWNPGGVEAPAAHECSWGMVLPPLVVGGLGVALGLFPGLAADLVLGVAAAMEVTRPETVALLTPAEQLNLADIWGTVGATLVAGGLILYFWDGLHQVLMRPFAVASRVGSRAIFDASLVALPRIAAWTTRGLQHGHGPRYLVLGTAAVLAALAAVVPAALSQALAAGGLPSDGLPSPGLAAGALMVVAGSAAILVLSDRFALVLAAGLVGYGSAVVFLFTGAPDVAFTQFLVETAFVIIAAAILIALRARGRATVHPDPRRALPMVLAAALATAITALLVAVLARPFDPALSDWFGAVSVPQAFGRNVVNVILVDFRAIDTLGEIVVITLSLMAALPLLQRVAGPHPAAPPPRVVMLDVIAGPVYWTILATAAVVYLRGHNEPGGGFIAGLLAVSATILWTVTHGSRAAEARLPTGNALALSATGIGLAILAGVPAWAWGLPFMTHLWATLPLGFTELKVSTVLIFDLGVLFAVWGGIGGYVLYLLGRDTAPHTPQAGAAP